MEFEIALHSLHSTDPRKSERQDRMLVLHRAVPPHPSLLAAHPDLHYGGRFVQTEAVKVR